MKRLVAVLDRVAYGISALIAAIIIVFTLHDWLIGF